MQTADPYPRCTSWHASHHTRSCGRRLSTEQREDLSSDVARVRARREKHIRWRDLLRLTRTLHGRLLSVLRRLLRLLVRNIERGPDRTRRDAVHANALLDETLRERFREGVDGAFRRRVVEQFLTSLHAGDGAGIHDRAAFLQVRDRGARHEKVTKDVRAERTLELLVGDLLDGRLMLLEGGVVHEPIEPSELAHGLLHRPAAEFRVAHVAGNEETSLTLGFDRGARLVGIALLLGQVHDGDVGAFARVEHRYRAPDAGVAARDERDAAF